MSYFIFNISLKNGDIFRLNSSDVKRYILEETYYPQCGLRLLQIDSNDSGDNIAIIEGIYHPDFINPGTDLSESVITIQQVIGDEIKLLGKVICTFCSKGDLGFKLVCNSAIIKYDKPLLQTFTKTCRANFGDKRCKVDPEKYIFTANIISIDGNRINYQRISGPDMTFTNNDAYLGDAQNPRRYPIKILSNLQNMLDYISDIEVDPSHCKHIIIMPSCNKKYITCCYSFNNAVNFRGEPHIPEFNAVKN